MKTKNIRQLIKTTHKITENEQTQNEKYNTLN